MDTGSKLVLVIEALFMILDLNGRLSATLTTKVKVALVPLASSGIEALIRPLLPAGGVVITHPGSADRDTKAKNGERLSDKLTFCASRGPLFFTVMV